MVQFDGKDYQKIALHGGGTPMFGHYVGLFESLKWFEDFESLHTPFITSSAGSMALFYFIVKSKDKDKDISPMFSKALEECENVLSNIDQKSLISFEVIENLISSEFTCICNMTFKDLNELSPNFEWTICCSKYDNFEFSLQTYGTHTPDVLIWKACAASMALPIIFPPIEINGCLNSDGELSNWVEEMHILNDDSILHIGAATRYDEKGFIGLEIKTEITLIDETIKFAICCFMKMMKKKEPVHGVIRTVFCPSINKHFFSEEYIESGKLMAKKFSENLY
jgi:hypothetical protein